MHINRKNSIYFIIAILLLALGLRITRLAFVDRFDVDGLTYIAMADSFANDNPNKACSFRPELPALFPYVIGKIKSIFGIKSEYIGIALNITFGVLAVWASYLITVVVFNQRSIAVIVALLCSVNPFMVDNSIGIMREQTALCLMLFSMYLIIHGIKSHKFKILYWIVSGGIIAIVSLIRPDGPEVIVCFILWTILSFVFCENERSIVVKKILPGVIILLIAFFVAVNPIQNYFNQHGSYFTVIPNAKTLRIYLRIK